MSQIYNLIGNTPMIKIVYEYKGKKGNIYTKLESYNLTGSIKDRVAYGIIKKALDTKVLKEKMPIIEATSGNTGISLAAIGAYYKHKVYIFMPDWASKERKQLIESFGANIKLISKNEGGFLTCIEEAKKLSKEINGFLANQFENEENIKAHYETTAEEIKNSLNKVNCNIGGFISGIGTGGTIIGIGKKLKENFKNIKVVAIEPEKMPLITGGKIIGTHKIEGIGDEFIPKLFDKNLIDGTILINDDDAINMSRKIAKDLGLGCGISSGANFIGSVILSSKIEKDIVTVFPDDNKKYLSTDLAKKDDNNINFISNNIKLIGYEYIEGSKESLN